MVLSFTTMALGGYFQSVQSGSWNDVNTWEQDNTFNPALRVPQGGDTVIINDGDTVIIDDQIDLTGQGPIYIQIEGKLLFQTGKKLLLDSGSGIKLIDSGSIILPGTGGGSANIIEIGDTVVWKSGDGPLAGPLDLGTTPTNPLPVTWVNVEVYERENQNIVRWKTSYEEFTKLFEVETSRDIKNWKYLGQVGQNQNGDYTFTDSSPPGGFNYYRIKHVEEWSVFSYSKIVSIFNKAQEINISVYPNPCTEKIFIEGLNNSEYTVRIMSISGKILNTREIDTSEKAYLNVNTLSPGIYILVIDGQQLHESIQFVKN